MKEKLEHYFGITKRGSTVPQELIAGLTIFFAMVYSVIVIPSMLSEVGFDQNTAFISTCLVAAFGSLMMGLWANLPMAIGCALSLTAFTAYSLVQGQGVSIPVALGAVFVTGVIYTGLTILGVRQWILDNLPAGIAQGTGIGIGLFLLLIAADTVGLVVKNQSSGLPVVLGEFVSIPVLLSVIGLAAIFGLEKRGTRGSVLLVIVFITIWGVIFDPSIEYQGVFARPYLVDMSIFGSMDVMGALAPLILPSVLALVLTSIFDATATIGAVAAQADLLDDKGRVLNGNKALTSDSVSTIFAGLVGGTPSAVYLESAAGTVAGGKTGLTAVVVGLLFLSMIFLAPLSALVPPYAAAPALMYVGLLMVGNVAKINFDDKVDAMSGLTCAVFILLTSNIVTGIMLGFATLVVGRIVAGEYKKLNIGIVITTVVLVGFYLGGWDI